MSEDFTGSGGAGADVPGAPDETAVGESVAPETGHPAVDAVLASLRDLDDKPVAEQVAVFEAAHEALRSALADAGNEPAGERDNRV